MKTFKKEAMNEFRCQYKLLMTEMFAGLSIEELKELGARHPKSGQIGVLTGLDILLTEDSKSKSTEDNSGFNQEEVWDRARRVERNFSNIVYGNTGKPRDEETSDVLDIACGFVMDNEIAFAKHIYRLGLFEQSRKELAHRFENEKALDNPYKLNKRYETNEPVSFGSNEVYSCLSMDLNPVDCFESPHCLKDAWIDIAVRPSGKINDIHRFSCIYCPDSYGQLQLVVYDCENETFTNGLIVEYKNGNIQISIGNGMCVMELRPVIAKDEEGETD